MFKFDVLKKCLLETIEKRLFFKKDQKLAKLSKKKAIEINFAKLKQKIRLN